jgi:hypothetical protein
LQSNKCYPSVVSEKMVMRLQDTWICKVVTTTITFFPSQHWLATFHHICTQTLLYKVMPLYAIWVDPEYCLMTHTSKNIRQPETVQMLYWNPVLCDSDFPQCLEFACNYWKIPLALFQFIWSLHDSHKIHSSRSLEYQYLLIVKDTEDLLLLPTILLCHLKHNNELCHDW